MSRFLFSAIPVPGHLNPFISVARAVQARGHSVAFYTDGRAHPQLRGEGFDVFPFENIDGDRIGDSWRSAVAVASMGLQAPLRIRRWIRDWVVGTIPDQVADLRLIIERWRPDALITDPLLWGPFLVLRETSGLPVALLTYGLGYRMGGSSPGAAAATGPGLPPSGNLMTRLLGAAVYLAGAGIRREVNRIRATYGLPAMGCSVDVYMARLPLYIVPNVREFDYRSTPPPGVHYVGPCVWNRPTRASAPSWLEEWPTDRPWVHVTEGTIHQQDPIVLRAAAQGLAHRPVQVVLTTGQHRHPDTLDLGPIAPNVRVEPWVSHSDLLPRCDAMVTTGGAGSVMAALQAGVPLVVVPAGGLVAWDKPLNARRVAAAGVGLTLAPRRCTPARLRSAVERVLADPGFRARARQLARRLAEAPGPSRAAELLESLARSAGRAPERAQHDPATCTSNR